MCVWLIILTLGPNVRYPEKKCRYDGKLFWNQEDLNYYIKNGKRKPKMAHFMVLEPNDNEDEEEERDDD